MLSVNNNIAALSSHHDLSVANNMMTKSISRLSSGLRINSAADDPSGLSISERMRTQIRGLSRAEENSQSALSLLQTAEGALNEVHSILQRMRELTVQAANGTLTSDDRLEVQHEIESLITETNAISTRTEFNTKRLLTGESSALWSASSSDMTALIRGQVEDGSYELEINSYPGVPQVLQTSVFRVKEGVSGIRELDLNGTASTMQGDLTTSGVPGNIDLTFNFGRSDIEFNYSTTGVTVMDNAQELVDAINDDHRLNDDIIASYDTAGNVSITARENGISGNGFHIAATGTGIDAADTGVHTFSGGNESQAGISGLANTNGMIPSTAADVVYQVNVDEGDDGALQKGAADVYDLVGQYMQDGSNGLSGASMLGDVTATAANGPVNMTFNFGGDDIAFTATTTTGAIITNADEIAAAINADTSLNTFIEAVSDGAGNVVFNAIDPSVATDYTVTINADPTVDTADHGDHAFSSGLGVLGVSPADAFTANSNSATGGYAIVEFTSEGSLGNPGLDARISFDEGKTWYSADDVWNGGTDVLVTDGEQTMEFNALFTNSTEGANFQVGDRLLVALNDNDNLTPTSHTLSIDANAGADSDVDLSIVIGGETFTIPNTTITAGDAAGSGTAITAATAAVVGSLGTPIANVLTITDDGIGNVTFASDAPFDITITENTVNDNISASQEGLHAGLEQGRDLTRVDAFDPSNGLPQTGAVFSHIDGVLDDSSNELQTAWINTDTGHIEFGQVDATFNESVTGQPLSDGVVTFNVVNGGGDVSGHTRLIDIDRFYDPDGNFILGEHGEYLTLYNGVGESTDILIDGGDTLQVLANKIQEAIISDEADGGLGMSSSDIVVDSHIVDFVDTPTRGTFENQQGSIVIRSPKTDKDGRFFFAASEDLLNALGISELQEAENNEMDITVRDAISGEFLGADTVSDNSLKGVIDGIDIEFDANYNLNVGWNTATRGFDFTATETTQLETINIVDNSLDFQIGANEGQIMNAYIAQVDSNALGIDRVQVTHAEAAKDSMRILDDAIDLVSQERSRIGAYVNRLDYTMANLAAQSENATAAESRIRDLDVARESTELAKQQMLSQASTSMLAQANQQAQNLLSLLQ